MLNEFRSTNITWDKATSRIYSTITANESDENGRKLVVQIVNGGEIEDLTGAALHLYWETKDKLHDGLDVFKAVDLEKGEFELSYTSGMLSNKGVLNANLVLINTTGRVVSEQFKITVTEGINNDKIQSEDSFTSLTRALIDIIDLEQNYAPRLSTIEQNQDSLAQQLKQKVTKAGKFFYVEDYGAKGDYDPIAKTGTNDRYAILAAINAAENAGGGTVVLDAKNYLVDKALVWRSGVSLIGKGEDKSFIYAVGNFNAVLWQPGATIANPDRNYNQDNPMRDMTFKGFTIDCSGITSNSKGILLFFLKNVLFEDITIIDSPATALGCDFLADSTMRRITTINAGRNMATIGIGCSGIGVGTGAWEIENLLVEDCKTIGSGNYGIFFEKQNYSTGGVSTPYYSTGMVVRNCVVEDSGVAGIGDNGVDGMVVENTIVRNNKRGFEILDGGINGRIINCQVYDNLMEGFLFVETPPHGYYIDDKTRIHGNGFSGINIDVPATTNNLTIKASIYNNGRNGFSTVSPLNHLKIMGGEFYDNGKRLGDINSQNGIVIRADLTQSIISNNSFYDTQTTKTQDYGLRISSVNVNQSIIKDNISQGNGVANINVSSDANVSTDSLIKDNIG